MSGAKIRLSSQELELLQNAEWILTKNRILDKAMQLLGQVQLQQQGHLQTRAHVLPQPVMASSPKISKGEQLQGLPYLVLDYPRVFTPGHFFAIRSLIWWGRFFSITLHLSGCYQQQFQAAIAGSRGRWIAENWLLASDGDPWQHDFDGNYYQPVAGIAANKWEQHLEGPFLKLAAYWPLHDWDMAESRLSAGFDSLLSGMLGQ